MTGKSFFAAYIQDRAILLIWTSIFCGLTLLVMFLDRTIRMMSSNIGYWGVISFSLLLIFITADIVICRIRWKKLIESTARKEIPGGEPYLPPRSAGFSALGAKVAKSLDQQRVKQSKELSRQLMDSQDFFSAWIHELKTPLSVIRLIVDGEQELPAYKKVRNELDRFNRILDQALFYLRGSSFEKDYVISEISMEVLVKNRLKKFVRLFSAGGMAVEFGNEWYSIHSDIKWLGFIIDQIIQNSLKYSPPKSRLLIYMDSSDDGDRIIFQDQGIGILPEDLPRVFDRGFTGQNGRNSDHSSGLGLYLSAILCRRLGHRILIDSTPGKGTEVTLFFPRWTEHFNPAMEPGDL